MLFAVVMAFGLAGAPSSTDCETAASDGQRASCLLQELEASDRRINASYAALRTALDDAGRLDLRNAQRTWIKRRDDVCRLANSQGSRTAWLAELSEDYAKTVCVVRFTDERAKELEVRVAQPRAAPAPMASPSVYDLAARTPRSAGKWYFETAVKVGDLAQAGEQALFIGVKTNGQSIGTLMTLHKRDIARGPVNIGIAVDLDAGKLYVRDNGAWRNGGPGSSGGEDLKLGRPYQGWVSSSAALDQPLAIHSLEPNFGQQAFAYALPDGYRPMDSQPPLAISQR